MKLTFDRFGGMAPKYPDVQLPAGMASLARDVRIDVGGVRPLRDFLAVPAIPTLASAESLYYYDAFDTWVLSTDPREYAGTVLPNDPHKRVFFTDPNYPKVRANADEYRLGIPSPTISSAAVIAAGDLSDPLLVETPAYVATYVDAWGAEGPPSLPMPASSNIGPGFVVSITMAAAPVGDFNLGTGALIRLYRTATGNSGTEYLFVGEVGIASVTLVDSVDTSALQEPLASATWIGPPDDDAVLWPDGPLRGVTDCGNGFLAGFSGNTVHFSEPYVPHAWPLDYRVPGPDPIVGIVAVARGILVLTTGRPWLATGSSPGSITRLPLETNQSCVSAGSIVDMGAYAIWASPDGLCASDGSEPRIITAPLLDKESWAAYQPSTVKAAYHEGLYVMSCSGDKDGAIFSVEGEGSGIALVEFTSAQKIVSFFYSLEQDELFCLMADGTTTEFDAGVDKDGIWRSAIVRAPAAAFNSIRVDSDRYPVEFIAGISDRILPFSFEAVYEHSGAVWNEGVYRLPTGMRAKNWQFTIHVASHIHIFETATSVRELT